MGKRLSKIYTRTGDKGETGLGDGNRVSKHSPRVEAMGDVDELNSWLGVVIEDVKDTGDAVAEVAEFLRVCQHRTFDLGGELSIPGYQLVQSEHVDAIEIQLDRLNADLPALDNFILPGGSHLIANLHLARSVCRRAERRVVDLAAEEPVNEHALMFLNRLSDYLFVAARHCARMTKVQEVLWIKSD